MNVCYNYPLTMFSFLLRNYLAVSKLLHTLRTSSSFDLLQDNDNAILKSVSSILNVRLEDTEKLQITLPTKLSGFGIVSASFIASSAFLSCLHAADSSCQVISSDWSLTNNASYQRALCVWKGQCFSFSTLSLSPYRQKSWTLPLHELQANRLLSSVDNSGRARLLVCKAKFQSWIAWIFCGRLAQSATVDSPWSPSEWSAASNRRLYPPWGPFP